MKPAAISELMINDHLKLIRQLKDVIDNNGANIQAWHRVFTTFKWSLEKHFFVEERAIFTAYNPEHISEGYDIFLQLSQEHTAMLKKLDVIEKNFLKGQQVSLTDFRELLLKHKKFEEKSIYPKLDFEISEAEKNFIIQRIQEVV